MRIHDCILRLSRILRHLFDVLIDINAAKLLRMKRIHLAEIHRFPLKGFRPQSLKSTMLTAGRGLPFDRAWGLTNTERAVAAHGGWTACQAFVRLTKNLDLPLFDVQFDDLSLRLQLRATDGRSMAVDLNDSASVDQANNVLAKWFPAKLASANMPQLAAASIDTGYWDHEDATISIIHLPAVAYLSKAAGVALDPARFRGNLLIDGGAAWEELAWPGHRLRVGDTELEVMRPIDRCVATSVNPRTAQKDINIPALLARHAGHVFCGVYARVVRGGELRAGDIVEQLAAQKALLHRASQPTTVPPAAQWPRAGYVVRVVQESEHVRSFWVRDALAADGIRVPFKPGQHLRLHAAGASGQHWRSYTISAQYDGGLWRISVKNAASGGVSEWLHHHAKPGTPLLLSGPHGAFHLPPVIERQTVFLSAGIGITPMAAMFASWAQREDILQNTPLLWIHSARHRGELALWQEALQFAQSCDATQAQLRLHLTEETSTNTSATADAPAHETGMVDWQTVSRDAKQNNADVYLCGPPGFMQAGLLALRQAGVEASSIHFERFASPRAEVAEQKKPPLPGPFHVTLARSNLQKSWSAQDGSLLEWAEQQGLSLPANCRGGACGACEQKLTSGEVMHLIEPMNGLAQQQILMCCAVPMGDLVIDI